MRWVRRIIGATAVVVVMIGGWWFADANSAAVRISYLWGDVDVTLWQALIGCFGGGFALGALGWLWFGVRSRLLQRRYRKAVGGLEAEIHQLRNLPLAPDAPGPAPARIERSGVRGGTWSG
jgi:uncharacterized membrane protein YciS (DUF1049 family)